MLTWYNWSLFPWVNILSTWTAVVNTPRLKPAGANHGYFILSFCPYIPGINVDIGIFTKLDVEGSIALIQGQYAAAYEVSLSWTFDIILMFLF